MVSVLAYVLITNTPKVYEATKGPIAASTEEWNAPDEVPDFPFGAVDANRIDQMRDFISFLGVGDPSKKRIPMNLATPWFWYLVFSGVVIFSLGRKIIKMLEEVIGYSGGSEMADSGLKSLKTGAKISAGAAVVGGLAYGAMAKGTGLGLGAAPAAAQQWHQRHRCRRFWSELGWWQGLQLQYLVKGRHGCRERGQELCIRQ